MSALTHGLMRGTACSGMNNNSQNSLTSVFFIAHTGLMSDFQNIRLFSDVPARLDLPVVLTKVSTWYTGNDAFDCWSGDWWHQVWCNWEKAGGRSPCCWDLKTLPLTCGGPRPWSFSRWGQAASSDAYHWNAGWSLGSFSFFFSAYILFVWVSFLFDCFDLQILLGAPAGWSDHKQESVQLHCFHFCCTARDREESSARQQNNFLPLGFWRRARTAQSLSAVLCDHDDGAVFTVLLFTLQSAVVV